MTSNALKRIAVIAMIIDHIAWAFLPIDDPMAQIMHFIGRITFPIMAYFIVEGFKYTSNIKRYITRMAIFAILSHLPFQYFKYGRIPLWQPMANDTVFTILYTSILYTFTISLIGLWVKHKSKLNPYIKNTLLLGLLILSTIGDYSIFGFILVMLFGQYQYNRRRQLIAGFIFTCLFIMLNYNISNPNTNHYLFGMMIPLLLLALYNDERKSYRSVIQKYAFYIIYPVHMLIIGYMRFNLI